MGAGGASRLSMSTKKRPHRKVNSKQSPSKRPVSRHTALTAHTGNPLVAAGVVQGVPDELLDPDNAAQLSFVLQMQQIFKDVTELGNIMSRAHNAVTALLCIHTAVETTEKDVAQVALQEFITCLHLLESKEQWAHEIRDSFVHRAQNGSLVPKSLEHNPIVQEKIPVVLQKLEAYLDAFEKLLNPMRESVPGLVKLISLLE